MAVAASPCLNQLHRTNPRIFESKSDLLGKLGTLERGVGAEAVGAWVFSAAPSPRQFDLAKIPLGRKGQYMAGWLSLGCTNIGHRLHVV